MRRRIYASGEADEIAALPAPPGIAAGDVLPSARVPLSPLQVDENGRVLCRELTDLPHSVTPCPNSWRFVSSEGSS